MTEKQEEKMIKAAHKYWADESGSYSKQDVMVDAFVEGYRQAFALYNVVGQGEQLSCPKCTSSMVIKFFPNHTKCTCFECKHEWAR